MVILAIDSGVEKTGYALFDKDKKYQENFKYLTSGLIQTSRVKLAEQRLLEIFSSLDKLIKIHKPETIILEQLFFFKNQKTVIKVSQAQGAIMLLAAQNKLKLEFLTPLQIKQIVTGYGQADKKSIAKMLKITLKLDGELKQDDQADAIACGLAYCYQNEDLR